MLLGTTGDDTRCVELALSSLGFTNVTVDGSFSAIDRDNPMWFQGSNGLTPDGAATAARLGVWGDPPPSTAVSCPITAAVQLGSTGPAAAYVEQALFNRGFSRALQRVWAVDAGSANPDIKFRYMVRFAYGPNGGRIGFHEIPTKYGVPIQSDSQLGQPLSGGCVRQATADAQWMWNWAGIGTKVVVL